jgi:hypothetical protein
MSRLLGLARRGEMADGVMATRVLGSSVRANDWYQLVGLGGSTLVLRFKKGWLAAPPTRAPAHDNGIGHQLAAQVLANWRYMHRSFLPAAPYSKQRVLYILHRLPKCC